MGIDVNSLPPWAQKQITQKLALRIAEKPQEPPKTQRKYRNTPDERNASESVIRFDSKKEARVYDELMLRLKAGQIRDLKLQPQYTLQEAYTTHDGKRIRAIRYQADFSYYDCGLGKEVIADVKSKATKTRIYEIKKKLMLEKFGVQITEIE